MLSRDMHIKVLLTPYNPNPDQHTPVISDEAYFSYDDYCTGRAAPIFNCSFTLYVQLQYIDRKQHICTLEI